MSKNLEKLSIPKVKKIKDSSMSKIFDKIMNTPACREFIDKYELTNKEIMDNFLPLLLVSENYEKCKNCNGLNNCPLEGVKGYFNVPVIDFYGTIDTEFKACKYMEERNLYIYRDFDDEKLNWFLKAEDMFSEERRSVGQKLGEIMNNKTKKGVLIIGESGIGKSYLVICFANRIVKTNKEKIAYVNVKNFVSEMTKLVIEDKALFNEKLDIIKNAPYLFLDGLGNEKISKFTRDEILANIFEYRKEKGLYKNIIITNYDCEKLKILYNVDSRIQANNFINLIVNMVDVEELNGLDFNFN